MEKVLFANVGPMKFYNGVTAEDPAPTVGGSYNRENVGHEVYNYTRFEGRCYGYFEPPHEGSNLDINRLGARGHDEYIDNVTVVWTAKSLNPMILGRYVVGWFRKARLWRKFQDRPPEGPWDPTILRHGNWYFTETHEKDAWLITDPGARNCRINGKFRNIKYEDLDDNGALPRWMQDCLDWMSTWEAKAAAGSGYPQSTDDEPSSRESQSLADDLIASLFVTPKGQDPWGRVKIRLRQADFRRVVLANFKNRCAVCGINEPCLLQAAHIKPYREFQDSADGRDDVRNGMCLCSLHHLAQEYKLLTFDSEGTIRLDHTVRKSTNHAVRLQLRAYEGKKVFLGKRRVTIA